MATTESTALDALPTNIQGFSRPGPDWVRAHRDQVRLVDVREPSEWKSNLAALDDADKVRLSELPTAWGEWDKDEPIVTICRSGGRSDRAAAALTRQGFKHVASMDGGMMAWYA